MLVVRVELHSAITGDVTTLATALIDNVGGTELRGDYRARAYAKGTWEKFKSGWDFVRKAKPIRSGTVENHPRITAPVWSLVRKSLESMGY